MCNSSTFTYFQSFHQKFLLAMEKTKGCSEHNDDDVFSAAMQLASSSALPFALRAAVELRLFEIIAASGSDFLSSKDIASCIDTHNSNAPVMVERILRFLASSSVLKYEVDDEHGSLLYGLNPICKYFVGDKDGVSLAPYLLLLQDKVVIESWYHVKDAVVDGIIPFNKAHGMSAFEFPARDQRFNEIFNQAMQSHTNITMKRIFEVYEGFEGLTEIIDVGGGSGANLGAIISKYPNIKGINFDLPHVIRDAPPCKGVEHVAGDMFEKVPSGEVIFMKYILHDWRDDECLRLLKICWKALSKHGKIIVVESVLPPYPETNDTNDIANNVFRSDLQMLTLNLGGKERTEREYNDLARKAGFTGTNVICNVHSVSVIEFYKM